MSLTSVASEIWNQIAETQELQTKWAQKAFRLDSDQMIELEDKEYGELKAKHGQEVAAALLDVKPLLLENVAISRFIRSRGHPGLRNALPELVTISEALMVAAMDRPLTEAQQEQLAVLLENEYQEP